MNDFVISMLLIVCISGIITKFILTRDGVELYRGIADQYIDETTVLPYKSYSYIISVCNIAGCTASESVNGMLHDVAYKL